MIWCERKIRYMCEKYFTDHVSARKPSYYACTLQFTVSIRQVCTEKLLDYGARSTVCLSLPWKIVSRFDGAYIRHVVPLKILSRAVDG